MAIIRSNSRKRFTVPQKIGSKKSNLNEGVISQSVESFVKLQVLSEVDALGMRAVFGTGVKMAELNQKVDFALSDRNQFPGANPDSIYSDNKKPVIPDANPDGKGGFTKTIGWGGYMSSSLLGMPVMCRLKFVGTSYTANNGTIITIPDIILETVIITLEMDKNIEKTTITGRDTGTVKEWISKGDWNIEIRAIITASAPLNSDIQSRNQDGSYPMENMEALMILINASISIEVECWFLNKVAGIKYITIDKGFKLDQIEGEYEMQRIIIPALSDNPLIITVAN